jgi:hypothetical protein
MASKSEPVFWCGLKKLSWWWWKRLHSSTDVVEAALCIPRNQNVSRILPVLLLKMWSRWVSLCD